jgi:hypothetical protein
LKLVVCLMLRSFEEEKPGRIDRRLCSDSSGVGLQMHEGGVGKVSLKSPLVRSTDVGGDRRR